VAGGVVPSDEVTDEPSDFGTLKPGTRLGRYELLVPIARGGMARVWAARQHGQRGFQKLVAIKTILPHLAEEPEFERMFLDEARIASGVHHPNVCEIYELGEERKTLYLAMEWVSGDSLSRVLRISGETVAIDVRVAARIVADACAGAHAAHELTDDEGRSLDVVHRDLSSHNVLLTADGVAKVCDFGVAKALGQLHEQTSVGQLKGKIAYMAPEQMTGGAIDRRSDVFSLGCLLYEATTGVRPFKGERDHQIMHAILQNAVLPPSQIVPGYPAALEQIVMRALAPKPILRFPTAERMRFALEELLAKGPLVTQANVAQLVRTRLGELLDRRKERIRQASSLSEAPPEPRARDASLERSGVKPARAVTETVPLPIVPEGAAETHEPTLRGQDPEPPVPAVTPQMGTPLIAAPVDDATVRELAPPAPSEPSVSRWPPPPPSSYAPLPPITEPERETRSGHYLLAGLIGLALALIIAASVYILWKTRAAHPPAPPPDRPAAAPEPLPTAAPVPIVTSSVPPPAASSAAPAHTTPPPRPHSRPRPAAPNPLPDNPY
jgi:eukaryotic-like serine/threonine-protein kinase